MLEGREIAERRVSAAAPSSRSERRDDGGTRVPRGPLGATGIAVGVLGLGTVKFGRTEGLKFPGAAVIPDDEGLRAILAVARDLGVNLIDTAPAYGSAEERLGRLLPGPREDWVIVTKAGEEFGGGASRFDFTAAAIARSVESSLRRLRTDHVDVVLLHSDGVVESTPAADEAYGALERLREAGKTRAIGASTKTESGTRRAIGRWGARGVVMIEYSAVHPESGPWIGAAAEAGAGVLIKKALASGHPDRCAAALGRSGGSFDPVEASLRFALGREGVSCVVIGTTNPGHLAHAAAGARRTGHTGEPDTCRR